MNIRPEAPSNDPMFDTEARKTEPTTPDEDLDLEAAANAVNEEAEEDEAEYAVSLDAQTLFSVDLATTRPLPRAEEDRLARRIVRERQRVLRVLQRARRLTQAALADAGRGVISPEEDFREREAVTILQFARQARLSRSGIKTTGLTPERLDAFVADLDAALGRYRIVRDDMMRANLRLVNLFARRYHHPVLTGLDLFQEGAIGLLRAIEKYDPQRNIKFSTYATWWIWQQLSRAADTSGSLIRQPVHWNQFRRRISRDERDLAGSTDGPASREEIAASHGIERERFEEMSQSFQFISTELPIGDDDDRTVESTLPSEEPQPSQRAEQKALRAQLEKALRCLPARERVILRQRFGLDDDEPETLEQLGTQFGVSRERIRQLEARGLKLLKTICARQGLTDYLQ